METIYTATVTSRGGRNGHLQSSDGIIDLEVRSPKEFGGEGGKYTNPEQLFAAGWAACFDSAMNMVARRKRLDVDKAEVKVSVMIGRDEDGTTYKLAAAIELIAPGLTQGDAEYLLEEAHKVCPYSKATRGNIDVKLQARIK